MRPFIAFFAALAVIGMAGTGCTRQQPAAGNRVALVGGTLIDGTGAQPLQDSVVLIRDDRIEAVGTAASLAVPADYQRISTQGMTVLPGLWDLHVHLLYAGHTDIQHWHRAYTSRYLSDIMPATAAQLLNAGVTSARDLGAPPEAIFSLKRQIQDGQLEGPTIFAAGPQLTRQFPDWARYYRWQILNAEDAAIKAGLLLDAGADTLKVVDAAALSVDEIAAIVRVAHSRGKKVAAHGRTLDEIRRALEGGVDEFEHIGTAYAEYPQGILDMLAARAASGSPVFWTITVGLPLSSEYFRNNPQAIDDAAGYGGLPADIVADMQASLSTYQPQLSAEEAAAIVRKVTQLRDAGVRLLLGTDGGLAGNFHSRAIYQEMEAWVNHLGFDPLTVIQHATSVSAEYMGLAEQTGTITAGRYADIVVVSGDPLQDITSLRNPRIVLKQGRQYK